MTGEVEKDEGVLVLKRVNAHFRLKLLEEAREVVERVTAVYQDGCPVARSIGGCVAISTSVEFA